MSKELPFFKFHSAEWLTGDISLENYRMQGIFIALCAEYWQRSCKLTQKCMKKRLKLDQKSTETLLELGLMSIENNQISIDFLDEQFAELSENHRKRVESGRKGGQKTSSNATSPPQAPLKHLDKDKDKEEDKEEDIDIKDIVSYLNLKSGKSFKSATPKTKTVIGARLKDGFSVEDAKRVIDTKVKEWTGGDMEKYIRPETLFGTKFEGYLNEAPSGASMNPVIQKTLKTIEKLKREGSSPEALKMMEERLEAEKVKYGE